MRSPNWHRHQRGLRRRARLRIAEARLVGSRPSRRDLGLLISHHSAPKYREVFNPHMGKQWGQHGGWSYWPGAFTPKRPPWHKQKQQDQQQQNQDQTQRTSATVRIDAYDSKKQSGAAPPEPLVQVISNTLTPGNTMVKDIQKAINVARKAENRLKKLEADRIEKGRLWLSWEKEVKQVYLQEKCRHAGNIEALDKEIREAKIAQDQARAQVRDIAAGDAAMDAVDLSNVPSSSQDVEEHLAALLSRDGQDPWEDFGSTAEEQAVLQRALLAAAAPRTPLASMPCPRTPVPVAEPRRLPTSAAPSGSRLVPFPPPKLQPGSAYTAVPGQSSASPPAATDPYLGAATPVPQPGGALTSPPLRMPRAPRTRTPVKDAARPTGPVQPLSISTSFQERADGKRMLAMQQLMEEAGRPPEGSRIANMDILDDDVEEDLAQLTTME